MGLTESNQSKSSFWGSSKSKGSHFPEGVYGGKPRQSVTLPSRPLTRNLNNSATSTDDGVLSIINSRPPDLIRYKDRSIYVSARELYSVPPSVQYSKQSEHAIKFSSPSLKLSTSSKNSDLISLNDGSTYSEPRNESQNILRFKNASLSEASLINETTDNYEYVSKRVRSRSHNYRKRDSSSGSRKACNNCTTSKEKETQTFSESPHFPNVYDYKSERSVIHTQRRAISFKENKNDSTRRSRKSGKRNAEKISCSVPTTPNEIVSDPYICLHYSNNLNQDIIKGSERENHNVTTRCPLYSEACLYIPKKEENLNAISESKTPKRKKSQIIIQLDNKNTNHVDSPYSVTVNKGAYEVCSNVWFESRVNVDEKNYFKNGNSAVNLNELSFNDQSKYEAVHPREVTDGCRNNALECKSKLTHNTNDVTKCISDSKSKEHCLLNSKIVNEPNKIQPIFNRCLNLSNLTTDDVKTYYSTSGYEINSDRSDSMDESDIHENSKERRHDKGQNYVETHEVRESEIPLTWEIENSSEKTIYDCNELSLDKNLTQIDVVMMKNNKDKIIKDLKCVKQGDIMHTIEPNEDNHCQMQGLESATLPSHSMSISNITSEDVWSDSGFRDGELCCDESQDNDFDKNTRTLSGSLIYGTFPILRLPKPASQPRLVDVLRRKSETFQDMPENLDTMLIKCSLNDPSRSGKCTLSNNILNVTKDENINFNKENITALNPFQHSTHQHCLDTEHKVASEAAKVVSQNNIHQMHKMEKSKECDQQLFSNVNNLNTAYNVPCSESVKSKQFSEPFCDFKNKTIPIRKDLTYREKVRRFFSLKLKHVEKTDSKIDCSLMCHEQCQGVVSLDCKMDSPDIDQFHDAKPHVEEDIPNADFFPLEDNENPVLPNDPNEEMEDCKEDIEEENKVNEGEEEKHEEEMLEKEIIFEQEILSQKKQEISTLRRTVRRIQSQAVDSAKIEEWVQKCPANNVGLQITKEEDGGYRGCLRIHLNLSRPINIVTGTRPPSIYDILQEERTLEKTLTSFYMPRDIVKAIHITSKTTTREVIVALLRKFKVVDNPQKFALYERTYDTGQSMKAKLRRLSDNECPLVLAIAWNAQDITNKRLVLQENDTADIQWEAFSLPELDNFLRILDREEGEYKNQIRDKYSLLRHRIQIQLSRIAPMNT